MQISAASSAYAALRQSMRFTKNTATNAPSAAPYTLLDPTIPAWRFVNPAPWTRPSTSAGMMLT